MVLSLLTLCACVNGLVLRPHSLRVRGAALGASVEAFVNEAAPELTAAIVAQRTELGTDIKRANAMTGGSALLKGAVLTRCDADGLGFECVVTRRVGGFGRATEDRSEAAAAAWADLLPDGGGGDAQRKLMAVAGALGLPGSAATLLAGGFPGGDRDRGSLPENLWLNNVPASTAARSHFSEAVIRAVLGALEDPESPPTLAVTVKPPELDVEMDTYRVGTLLELVRSLTFRIIDESGKRVRVCVQRPMGEGIFAGLPLSLNGVRKLLELMDWGPQGAALMADKMIRFGAIGDTEEDIDDDDDVLILIAPQSIVGSSVVDPLEAMVAAAGPNRKIVTINARLGDVQSAAGVMSYRGRADRLDFVARFAEIFHFSLVVPMGRTFFPILGAVVRADARAPYVLYRRRERADPPSVFRDSVARAAAVERGDLVESYDPVGAYPECPDAKLWKPAFRAAQVADAAGAAGAADAAAPWKG